MSIKNNKPTRKSKFKQGYYPINECNKYVGKGPIIYRSSWEQKFCIYCESNKHVVKWSSEPFEIKYFNPLKQAYSHYYPDFYMELDDGKKLVIEVKPSSHLKKPSEPKRKTKKAVEGYKYIMEQYILNMAKFNAATKWCENRGYKFKIITEDFF